MPVGKGKGTTQNTQETSAFRKTPKLLVRGDHKILIVSARLEVVVVGGSG